jgi:HAD superfamily hydrolase (TIGR01490 family)
MQSNPVHQKPPKKLIAIYDMDKTVTRHATYSGYLQHIVRGHARWRALMLPILPVGLALYAAKIWSRGRLKEFSQSLFIGQSADWRKLSPLSDTFADTVWLDDIYPEARERIVAEKHEGYLHVLATASYEIYASAIGSRIGFRHIIGTELEMGDGSRMIAKIRGENCYGEAKMDRIRAWLADQGLSREDCYIRAYSDHISDTPLLEFADEAFATNPHPPLAKLAKARGWAILDWR